ncbi:nicotinamide/nicotinic acid mononucleotide adenylyltransferase 1 isoform X1 [Myzus persicae]|uniref:nicotinamide/nicotinic acid mononucleotide adenylyltransferase 1 isoform X1 n=1 Tax=Myzus persicae TaxID=13164 RepID=UPI000B936485|nr:nicotinamide/nicotinic acid mononucleotide adenylyltransferase 1 isoform X1 [Myzus persicae]
MFLDNKNIILLSTGSFNPPTNMHLRMFEIARDHLNRLGHTICGGLISPTHDSYKKKDLAPSSHRCAMIEQALVALPWVKMSDWEVKQNGWTKTRQVLQYHQNHLNMLITSRLNGAIKVDNSLFPVQFIENLNINDSNQNRAVNVRLLCGADLLESFAVPGLWNDDDIEAIVRDYGLVVVSRSGSNPHKFIYESNVLTKYMANIIVVTEWITNEVSSTKVRRALSRNESVKFLISELVESYIKEHGLYETLNNKYSTNDILDINSKSVFLSPSPSNKALKTYKMDDKKLNIDEPDSQPCTEKRAVNCEKTKVRNVAESKENFTRVAIQVSESGIIEVISDMETMV